MRVLSLFLVAICVLSFQNCGSLVGVEPQFISSSNSPTQIPSFGLMSNDDGDNAFQSADPVTNIQLVKSYMTALASADVETLQFNVAAGTLYYPSEVGSTYAWKLSKRFPTSSLNCGSAATGYLEFENACVAAYGAENCTLKQNVCETLGRPHPTSCTGHIDTWVRTCWAHNTFLTGQDPIRIAGETFLSASKARGKKPHFFISYRVSDDHFTYAPHKYPLTTKFWYTHQTSAAIKASGKPAPLSYPMNLDNMLNFQHKIVRDQLVKEVTEAIHRYQDIASGVELDFTRTPYLFPALSANESSELITEMVSEVREMLVELELKHRKPFYLLVRVPPSLNNSKWAGLDVESWMRQRLVHVVIPSHIMIINGEIPIQEFTNIAKQSGVAVYAGLPNRQNFNLENVGSPSFAGSKVAGCYTGICGAHPAPLPGTIIGAALNLKAQGADGFQLYNFASPSYLEADWFIDLSKKLALTGNTFSQELLKIPHEYVIAQPSAAAWEGHHEPAAQLPVIIGNKNPTSLTLSLAVDPTTLTLQPHLRLGLYRNSYERSMSILINGKTVVHNVLVKDYLRITNQTNTLANELQRDKIVYSVIPGSYLHIPITNKSVLKKGKNKIEIYFEEPTSLLDLRIGLMD